jgi:predicted  nucleic acid-binding Zn-ribbon protein
MVFQEDYEMKNLRHITFYFLPVLCLLLLAGCGAKTDEDKPLSDVKAEAEQMSVEKLRSMAMAYKDAILDKKREVEALSLKLKDIPLTEKLGNEAKGLKADIDDLSKSISALNDRFQVYYNKIKEKGGDLSGLKI